jgi:transcriptional regulator GlxA family with amidase domain
VRQSREVPRSVVILCFDGCQSLDVTGPLEVFAGAVAAQRRRGVRVGYAPKVVALKAGPLRTASGLRLIAEASLAELTARPYDTLIVAGGEGARLASERPEVGRAVARAARRARRVASVCTGAFVLAAAGLLEGRRATTHFAYCRELGARFPSLQIDADPIYIRDGNVWTSAGVTAGIDLALGMVEEDYGPELSLLIARHLVVFIRRAGGQSQFSAQMEAQAAAAGPIRELQSFIAEHPESELDVPALARRAAMSVRHFSRVFRREVGVAPARYVERVRVETARRLLETTPDNVDGVARAAGFGTPEAMRRALSRRVGLSPTEYRARFSTRAAS